MEIKWLDGSQPFLTYLDGWYEQLSDGNLDAVMDHPSRTAFISVDVINGFCHEGPLSSPRVKAIIAPITRLLEKAWEAGVREIVLTQDTHEMSAVEFDQYPPHCVRGTNEAETVPEIKALPFYDHMTIIEKNSIHSGLDTGLSDWISDHPTIDRFIVTGDCTDLCTYQLAMHLRLDANARQLERKVIIPVDCVDTYDLPVHVAEDIGAVPHDAELLHRIFLYSMMLNGVEIYAKLI